MRSLKKTSNIVQGLCVSCSIYFCPQSQQSINSPFNLEKSIKSRTKQRAHYSVFSMQNRSPQKPFFRPSIYRSSELISEHGKSPIFTTTRFVLIHIALSLSLLHSFARSFSFLASSFFHPRFGSGGKKYSEFIASLDSLILEQFTSSHGFIVEIFIFQAGASSFKPSKSC